MNWNVPVGEGYFGTGGSFMVKRTITMPVRDYLKRHKQSLVHLKSSQKVKGILEKMSGEKRKMPDKKKKTALHKRTLSLNEKSISRPKVDEVPIGSPVEIKISDGKVAVLHVIESGKRKTMATNVGPSFSRKRPKHKRFNCPSGLCFTKAHVIHRGHNRTFKLEIVGVKKNPNGAKNTTLNVITCGTIIKVNCSELGLVSPAGKVMWGKYARVTNYPETDGFVCAVLLI